jgi:site-specific DNA-cytosine methylase
MNSISTGIISSVRTIYHAHLFCGLGGGAKGFNGAQPRMGNLLGRFECLGGIDVDPGAIADFEQLAGVKGTVLDLFDEEQYREFYGCKPPSGWRPAGPADLHRAFQNKRPHVVFASPPCKGLSGLLSEAKSKTTKYQALNRLTVRGVWLMLEAYKDDPIELFLLENVPRIATRGRHLLDQIVQLLEAYGYRVAETTHDCGEIGGLAQSRKRFLLIARHMAKIPPLLFQPTKHRLRGVGEVLGAMPFPGDPAAGPMHRVPALQWQTWVRLAFVEAGSDWRSLNKLAVENGHLRDYLIVPEMRGGGLGVKRWEDAAGTVAGKSLPTNGTFSVADPRFAASDRWKDGQQYGVTRWDQTSHTIAGQQAPGQGRYAVADPRHTGPAKHNNCFRIVPWGEASPAVTAGTGPTAGGLAVADPRPKNNRQFENIYRVQGWDQHSRTVIGRAQPSDGGLCVADPRATSSYGGKGKYPVSGWDDPAGTVISSSTTGHGAFAVADPRPAGLSREKGDAYLTAGHYGVVGWNEPSGAVSAAACHDNGRWAVADPRLPATTDRLVCVIEALDGTWHRPFTTLELAALQSLVSPGETLQLAGSSDQDWRERIGNAVPADAARGIAETIGETLLAAWSGETFLLSSRPVWVQPVAIALSVASPEERQW